MVKRLSFSTAALRDLNEIWDESEKRWGGQRAFEYVEDIVARSRNAMKGMTARKSVTIEATTFLRIRSTSHYVFLVELPDKFQVVRILHVRRDPRRHLS
ncbi:MAG: toxin ParE1/3/4 [Sphingomonadales bacterium]|nr:toxin ParE1/3/4 [Sphingomonadales bacterium]